LDGDAQPVASAHQGSETNTLPWSMTTWSGTITGRAAASRMRASIATSRSYGGRDIDIRSADGQPRRIGSGTSILASTSDASTALVPTGRSTAAQMLRSPPSRRRPGHVVVVDQHRRVGLGPLGQLRRPDRMHPPGAFALASSNNFVPNPLVANATARPQPQQWPRRPIRSPRRGSARIHRGLPGGDGAAEQLAPG